MVRSLRVPLRNARARYLRSTPRRSLRAGTDAFAPVEYGPADSR
jgi:hypothetical protein